MNDIVFESIDFSEKKVLPVSSRDIGYTSISTLTEFLGNGDFQAVFYDTETEEFIKRHPEGLIVKWDRFQGFITDWQFKNKEKWLFGGHINAILHKFTIPPQTISEANLQTTLKTLFAENISCISFVENKEGFGKISYTTEKYMYADEFIKGMLSTAKLGYRVYADKGTYYFEILKPRNNPLMLSKNNLNVYEVQEDFSNKGIAFGGWYYKTKEDNGTELETPKWTYIKKEAKEGIFKQDVILQASSPQEATDELSTYSNSYKTLCKTRNIQFQEDYQLGDIVRLQVGDRTTYKQITSVDVWQEGTALHEEPTLSEQEG